MAKKQYPARKSRNNPVQKKEEQQESQLQKTTTISHQQYQYSGPLPDPHTLARFDEVLPGAAERILKMAEENAQHFREIEKLAINAQIDENERCHRDIRVGQSAAVFAIISSFCLAGYALYLDHGTVAGTICSVTVGALVAVFITGKAINGNGDKNGQNTPASTDIETRQE